MSQSPAHTVYILLLFRGALTFDSPSSLSNTVHSGLLSVPGFTSLPLAVARLLKFLASSSDENPELFSLFSSMFFVVFASTAFALPGIEKT
jgi:hypothetical protein